MTSSPRNVLLQGYPGTGKTTLIKKIADKLTDMNLPVGGFYTEEKRENNIRVGFDVVTLDNKVQRGILARKCGVDTANTTNKSKFKVGAYSVFVEDFEQLSLPLFDEPKRIFIIDEIGKMELFSRKFQLAVEKLITNPAVTIIATVPLTGSARLILQLKQNPLFQLITVNSQNRNGLLDEITANIKENS